MEVQVTHPHFGKRLLLAAAANAVEALWHGPYVLISLVCLLLALTSLEQLVESCYLAVQTKTSFLGEVHPKPSAQRAMTEQLVRGTTSDLLAAVGGHKIDLQTHDSSALMED